MLQDKVQIIVKGEDETYKISAWEENNGKINITYADGGSFSYNKKNVQIIKSALSDEMTLHRFEYLKRLAHTNELKDEDGNKILANRYDKIDYLCEGSMLTAFLTGQLQSSTKEKPTIIFPFGFNISQKTAVDNALLNPLSIIEGPPGTGKTQTILNIIANAVIRGKNVAVVSNNNSATENVYEKLEKYKVNFIAALLGSSENKKIFVESQKPLPYMADWKLSTEDKRSMFNSLKNLYSALNTMLENKNTLSQIQQELDAVNLEYEHFSKYYDDSNKLSLLCLEHNITLTAALELRIACEKCVNRGKMPGILERFINRLLFGVLDQTFYRHRKVIKKAFYSTDPNIVIKICQKCWYDARIAELTENVSRIQAELDNFNFDEKMHNYTALSARLFCGYIAQKYNGKERKSFELDDLWKNSKAFIQEYPVILSTTFSLRSSLSYMVMYDYVIIDESSQVDLVTGALALSCAKNAVIVGDLKQLQNVVDSETARKTDNIFTEFNMPECYRYKNHSLLQSLVEMFPNLPQILLREHYRCHPKIIGFCNQKFYDNQLIILTEPKSNRKPLIVTNTTSGNQVIKNVNQAQIDFIKYQIIPQQGLGDEITPIGIVTPYRNQTNELQQAFNGNKNIQADTVDKFQGREKDVIILSTVAINSFTDNPNRLNVAISRAVEQLIVVVNMGDDMRDKNIGDLVRYIEYNNLDAIQNEIRSIFDYLYSGFRRQMEKYITEKVSEYPSENLMYKTIKEILNMEKYKRFDVAIHHPFREIYRDIEKIELTTKEKRYALHRWTHVDFLIYEKIGKIPRLVIEVDGVTFHADGTKQKENDELKNSILQKFNLPIERFRTQGECNEHKRLIVALDKIL